MSDLVGTRKITRQLQHHKQKVDDGGMEVLPKYQPHLHKIRPKDPVEQNHFGHGPEYMETEYKTTFENKYKIGYFV